MDVTMSKQRTSGRRVGMRARLTLACFVVACAAPLFAHAQTDDPVKELAAPQPLQLPLKPNPAYAQFPRYVGTLGNRQIVLRLGAKGGDDAQGVHGEYQYTDTGEVILVAGDRDGNTLEIEESNDGKRIVGNWVGTFAADGSLSGDRMNVDDSSPQPFELKPLASGQSVPASTSQTAPAAAPQPGAAAPAQGGQPVGGVSNLRTGD
jgi:hypothetical protein